MVANAHGGMWPDERGIPRAGHPPIGKPRPAARSGLITRHAVLPRLSRGKSAA